MEQEITRNAFAASGRTYLTGQGRGAPPRDQGRQKMGTEEGAKEFRVTAEERAGLCPACRGSHEYQRRLPSGSLPWPSDHMQECKAFQAGNPKQRAKVIQDQGGCVICLSWAHPKFKFQLVWRHTEGGPSIGCEEKKGSRVCGCQHHRLLQDSNLAYASDNAVAGFLGGQGSSRPDWFSGVPMGSLLTEGTEGTIFEIRLAPVVSVEGRKTQSIMFIDPGSIIISLPANWPTSCS